MYTDPGHLRVQDPGKIEGNTVFTYLDAFCRPEHFERYLPDYPNLAELKAHYQRGGLGDVKVKRFLNAIMQETLEPIRNRRKEFSKDIPAVYEMLQKGCGVARAAAAETLADVKKAMKINYFDDKESDRGTSKTFLTRISRQQIGQLISKGCRSIKEQVAFIIVISTTKISPFRLHHF